MVAATSAPLKFCIRGSHSHHPQTTPLTGLVARIVIPLQFHTHNKYLYSTNKNSLLETLMFTALLWTCLNTYIGIISLDNHGEKPTQSELTLILAFLMKYWQAPAQLILLFVHFIFTFVLFQFTNLLSQSQKMLHLEHTGMLCCKALNLFAWDFLPGLSKFSETAGALEMQLHEEETYLPMSLKIRQHPLKDKSKNVEMQKLQSFFCLRKHSFYFSPYMLPLPPLTSRITCEVISCLFPQSCRQQPMRWNRGGEITAWLSYCASVYNLWRKNSEHNCHFQR